MSRRVNKHERAFRRSVAIEYMQSGKDRQEICLKYGLKSQATLSNWVSCYLTPYEIETKCVSLHPEELYSASNRGKLNRDKKDTEQHASFCAGIEQKLCLRIVIAAPFVVFYRLI